MNASNHFATLGLAATYDIDAGELERNYLALQQRHHPDRVASGGSLSEQRAAQERSAAINEGYRVLRDPVRRAEYLCRLGGIDLDAADPQHGAPSMPPAFLMDMIERREHLAEARSRGGAALDTMRDEVQQQLDDATARAATALRAQAIAEAARALVERRYLQRLLDEIDAEP